MGSNKLNPYKILLNCWGFKLQTIFDWCPPAPDSDSYNLCYKETINSKKTNESLQLGCFLVMTTLASSWLLTFSTAQLIVLLYCMFFGFIVFWLVFYLTSIVTGHTKTIMVTVSVEHQSFLVGMKTTKLRIWC